MDPRFALRRPRMTVRWERFQDTLRDKTKLSNKKIAKLAIYYFRSKDVLNFSGK